MVVNNVDGLGGVPLVPDPSRSDLDGEADAALLERAASFRRSRRQVQEEEIGRLRAELALEQWHLPQLPVAGLGPSDVAGLAASIRAGTAQ